VNFLTPISALAETTNKKRKNKKRVWKLKHLKTEKQEDQGDFIILRI